MTKTCQVVVVGGGPSGLACALALRDAGVGEVVVLEREPEAGGVPRHCAHTGYGLRDLRRLMTGPRYARHYVLAAERAGVEIRPETFATGWSGPTSLETTSPHGLERIEAAAVVLATGCRERPRSARLVPGTRPAGVFTTGSLQQFVYLYKIPVGRRALIVGAEHVSFSAVLTLAHAGVEVLGLVTEHAVDQTYPWLRAATAGLRRVPVWRGQRVVEVLGRARVEAAVVADLATGAQRRVECDTIVFSGDWVPDHELARAGGLVQDEKTKGPWIDSAQRTSARGVFAAGNLLHAAETADFSALCGREVAYRVASFLRDGRWAERPPVPIEYDTPIKWVSPSAVDVPAVLPHGRFVLRVDRVLEQPLLKATQGQRVLWNKRFARLRPGLPIHIPGGWARSLQPGPEPLRLELAP